MLLQTVDNVESLYIQAGMPQGSNWFHSARADVQSLADETGFPFHLVAAVVATLSPRIKWSAKNSMPNLDAARSLIKGFKAHRAKAEVFKNVAGFDHNKIKAWKILRTGNVEFCSGPKVWAFFQNLIDPDNDTYLTIDSWMTCIGLGLDFTQGKDTIIPNIKQHRAISDALRIVAYGYGMPAIELQAALWVYAKEQAGIVNFRYQ